MLTPKITIAVIPSTAFATEEPFAFTSSNENKMSDGGRGRASLGVEGWKSSQNWSVQRSAVRSIAWLGVCFALICELNDTTIKWLRGDKT